MKTKIRRNVFETNSSSVHAITLHSSNSLETFPIEFIDLTEGFGWEFKTYTEANDKAAYLYIMFVECAREDYANDLVSMINEENYKNGYAYDVVVIGLDNMGYIDHASALAKEDVDNLHNSMRDIIYGANEIYTGNDNEEYDFHLDYVPHILKGN